VFQAAWKSIAEWAERAYNAPQMGDVVCPRCQAEVAHAAGQAYCPKCGWNRHVAIHQVDSLRRLLPVLLLPLVAFGMLLVSRQQSWISFLLVIAVGGLLWLLAARSLGRALVRLQSARPTVTVTSRLGPLADPLEEEEARAKLLLDAPRPRPVRLTSAGRFYLIALAGVGVLFELLLLRRVYRSLSEPGTLSALPVIHWLEIALAGLVLGVLVALLVGLVRQKRLLSVGGVAVGRVTSQWRVRGSSWIRYQVEVGGSTVEKSVADPTHRFHPGMALPVFYDPEDHSRQVACCAAFYQVVLPPAR
jgi:hypothetical protein